MIQKNHAPNMIVKIYNTEQLNSVLLMTAVSITAALQAPFGEAVYQSLISK